MRLNFTALLPVSRDAASEALPDFHTDAKNKGRARDCDPRLRS